MINVSLRTEETFLQYFLVISRKYCRGGLWTIDWMEFINKMNKNDTIVSEINWDGSISGFVIHCILRFLRPTKLSVI